MSTLKDRADVKIEDKWKVEDLFERDELWEEELSSLEGDLKELESYRGGLTLDNIYSCLQLRDRLYQRFERVYVYAGLKANEDSGNTRYQGYNDRAERLGVRVGAAAAFIDPSILELDRESLVAMLEDEPMSLYKHYISDTLRSSEHILSPDKEELLANMGEVMGVPSNVFYMLNNADIEFATAVDSEGKEHSVTHGQYSALLESSDRTLRRSAFESVYSAYLKQKNTIAAVYSGSVKKDVFIAGARNYSDALEASLSPNNIPTEVYKNLIDTVSRYLPLLHRYISLRKKTLGVEELHFYDLYTPLVAEYNTSVSYEEAVSKVKEAVKPLGEDYCRVFNSAVDKERWIDKFENKGKRSGAYSWGAYGCHPFVSLNFNNNIDSMFTLAHEMGHAMHSYYTWENQPFVYGDYTIFVAEVASTVNEALLMEHLLANTEDKHEKMYLINYFMEQFRGTLFRQTMFAEFELIVHDMAQKGEPLTFEALNAVYQSLNAKYYGEDILLDEQIAWEWARIPHFYTPFYVYQYATGYSAAIALSQRVLKENGAEDYISFLKGGSSKYSIDLLKGAGVDMATPKPVEQAMSTFESLLDMAEELLGCNE
jgi:oligoendopeptidase F